MLNKDKLRDQTPSPAPPEPVSLTPPRIFWSGKQSGFFHKNAPEDAIEISTAEWRALLEANSKGKNIVPGPDGRPIAIDPVVTPAMQRASIEAQITQIRTAPETLDAHREALLGKPGAKDRLAAIDAKIVALRASMPPIQSLEAAKP